MKLNAFRRSSAFEPQTPPLPIAFHWWCHIFIICLVLQSWVCDLLKRRRYATISPWIVSWIISFLQRQRLESNHQTPWEGGVLGTTFFFLCRFRNTCIEGRKQVPSFYEREVQDHTDATGTQAASVGLFAHCLFPLLSQFWAEDEIWERQRENKLRDTEGFTNFKLVCPGHGPLPEDGEGFGLTPWWDGYWADWLLKQPILWPHKKAEPFLSSFISLPCSVVHLPGRKGNLGAQRKVDSILFSKLRRGTWEYVRLDLGLGLGLVLCSCSTFAISLPELSVDPVG